MKPLPGDSLFLRAEPCAATAARNDAREPGSNPAPCVLVVEDDALVRDLVETVLSTYGYAVVSAASASEALEIFAKPHGPISLVLSDMEMPVMSGISLAHELKKRYGFDRVVISSGHSSEAVTEAVASHDLAGFIMKPYRPASLIAEVRRVLGE